MGYSNDHMLNQRGVVYKVSADVKQPQMPLHGLVQAVCAGAIV